MAATSSRSVSGLASGAFMGRNVAEFCVSTSGGLLSLSLSTAGTPYCAVLGPCTLSAHMLTGYDRVLSCLHAVYHFASARPVDNTIIYVASKDSYCFVAPQGKKYMTK